MNRISRIVCVMHVPFEGPGIIENWARNRRIPLHFIRLFEQDPFPRIKTGDLLLILGGPMNVYDFHIHPWMEEEIEWVGKVIDKGNPVLGICLGAQVVATALQAEVLPGGTKEIGWHQLKFLPSIGDFRIWKEHPGSLTAFHWHGDTFEIPESAVRIASSEAFSNQGFIYGNRVVALQFHLEVTAGSVKELVENCRGDLVPGPHVQSEQEILKNTGHIKTNTGVMEGLLDWMIT